MRRFKRRMKGKGGFCCYCKRGPLADAASPSRLAFTRDHVNPKKFGGGRTVPCCAQCNGLKGSLHPKEWFWFIDAHPGYWRVFETNRDVLIAVARERVRRQGAGEPQLFERRLAPLSDEEVHTQWQ